MKINREKLFTSVIVIMIASVILQLTGVKDAALFYSRIGFIMLIIHIVTDND